MTPLLNNLITERYIQMLISGLVACLVSIESIPVIINISRLKNLMDVPGERSSHSNKTPTLGGVAIFASILIGYFIWENPDGGLLINLSIVGVVILFFLGVKDDILILSPVKKMIFQIVASSLVIIGADLRIDNFFGIFGVYEIPIIFSFIITVFIFIALINAMNLIDGIDGLGGGIGMIASGVFGIWFYLNRQPALACLAISLAGALLGFLRYNFSKTSKIFMGDTGSLISGFLLTVFAVRFVQLNAASRFDPNAYFNAPILAIIVLVIPIFDTLRVFLSRIYNKRSPFVGDRNHLHHILVDLGNSHFMASFILCSITISCTLIFLALDDFLTSTQSMFLVLGLFLIYIAVCQFLKNKVIKKAESNIGKMADQQ
jgi:UDP-N-acetylmuramyl pentapeptide phosphotransferase/UDP-N-acetylglucosamine-1-phosphate transferase